MLSEKAPLSAVLNFIALLYIVNCCMIIQIVSSIIEHYHIIIIIIIIIEHYHIFASVYFFWFTVFLLGLFIVLCDRLSMLQRCRVVWDVVCPTCVSR